MPNTLRGIARVDKRTKNLVKRLHPGEIAVVDHRDMDSVSAEALAAGGVKAVVNADQTISGRYPNRGPAILFEHNIPILDNVGPEVMQAVREGSEIEVDLATASVSLNGATLGSGTVLTPAIVEERSAAAEANLRGELRRFVENTLQYVSQEEHILFDPTHVPELTTPLWGRHALIVVRGENYREDLRAIRPYIRDLHPALIGVDGGADALIELGYRPDIIIGDMDSVSEDALRCGAELVVHSSSNRGAPGMARLESAGLQGKTLEATGTSEDVAMLLAYEKGADLIVAVGTHSTLVDFLDKGRAGMASTFLTRLKIGNRLVDARGVNRLYSRRPKVREIMLLLGAGVLVIVVLIGVSTPARSFVALLGRLMILWLRRILPWM